MGLSQKSLTGIKKLFLFRVSMDPLKDWKVKLKRVHFIKVQYGRITVCLHFEFIEVYDYLLTVSD